MKKTQDKQTDAADLRRQAEEHLKGKQKTQRAGAGDQTDTAETKRLLHELQVHRVELEMQNEELKRDRAELEEVLAQYAELYDFAPVGYFTLDRSGVISRANLTGAHLLEMERAMLIGRRFGHFLSETDRSDFNVFLEKVFASKTKESCEAALHKKEKCPPSPEPSGRRRLGETSRLVLHVDALASDDGQKCRVVAVDITDREKAEAALRETEQRMRIFLDSTSDMAFLKDESSRHIIANRALCKFYGKTESEIIGKTDFDLMTEKEAAECKRTDKEALLSNAIVITEEVVGGRCYETMKFPVELGEGKRGIGAYISDITERKLAEEILKKKDEEILEMNRQLWQAAKLATIGELASSIAHELNNPLATVSLRVESLFGKTPEDHPNHRELAIIEKEVERMSILIDNLLQFSRRSPQQISTVIVSKEIEKTFELIDFHLRKCNIKVVKEFAPDVPAIHADHNQLRQMFINLFTNAADAMPLGGTLTVRVHALPDAEQIGIEIADTGVGIPPGLLTKVMDPFYTTKPEGSGTGLGLAICSRIAKAHRGDLQIMSDGEPGKGTRIYITLAVSNVTNTAGLTQENR